MKNIVLVVTCLLMPIMVFGYCERCKPKDKVYVEFDDLIFDAKGIWFKNSVEGIRIGTEAIHVDSFGYYVSKDEEKETWLCPRCTYVNKGRYPGFWGCLNCGFPYI